MLGTGVSLLSRATNGAGGQAAAPVIAVTSGTGYAGSVLSADLPGGAWFADGAAIPGATGQNWIRTGVCEGAAISYRIGALASNVIAPAYTLPTPVLLESFDTDTGFTVTGTMTRTVDPASKMQGAASLLVTNSSGAAQSFGITKELGTLDPAELGTLAYYLERVSPASAGNHWLYLRRQPSGYTEFVSQANQNSYAMGGRWLSAHVSEFPGFAGGGTGLAGFRMLHQNVTPFGASFRHDALFAQAQGRPTVLFTFDDMWDTCRTVALPILSAVGMTATAYASPGLLGSGGIKMTTAQLQTLYAAGWDITCNSWLDTDLTIVPLAEAVADVLAIRSYLVANGMPRAANHGTWPYGNFTEELVNALLAEGMISFRGAKSAHSFHTRFGIGRSHQVNLPARGLNITSGTLAQAKADVDKAVLRGETLIVYAHDLRETPSAVGWTPADFQALVDYVAVLRDAGTVSVLTQTGLWARDGAKTAP